MDDGTPNLRGANRNLHLKSSKRRHLCLPPSSKMARTAAWWRTGDMPLLLGLQTSFQKPPGFFGTDFSHGFPRPCTWPCVGCMLLWQHMQLLQLLLCTLIEASNGRSFPTWVLLLNWLSWTGFCWGDSFHTSCSTSCTCKVEASFKYPKPKGDSTKSTNNCLCRTRATGMIRSRPSRIRAGLLQPNTLRKS